MDFLIQKVVIVIKNNKTALIIKVLVTKVIQVKIHKIIIILIISLMKIMIRI